MPDIRLPNLVTADGRTLAVRRLARSDAAALQAFNRALSEAVRNRFLPHLYDDATVDRVLRRSETGEDFSLGAFDGQRLAGYFFLWHAREPIPHLGIGMLDEFQHRGLGRQMMALLIAEARATGREGIALITVKGNENAYALYERMGFRFVHDIEHGTADGRVVVERAMFLALKPDACPPMDWVGPPP